MEKRRTTLDKLWNSRLFWAIISVLCACLLWAYVNSTEGQLTRTTLEGVLVEYSGADTLRETKGLLVTNMDTTTIDLTLEGPRRVIGALSSKDVKAVVDLSTITVAGNYNRYSYTLSYPNGVDPSEISATRTPTTVSFTVDKLSSKWIEVEGRFDGGTAEGFIGDTSDMTITPSTVRISGPESEISQVDHALVVIERDDVDKTIQVDMSYDLVNESDEIVEYSEILLDTETVNVVLPINSVKTVPLTVDLIAGGGAGEANVKPEFSPSEIEISGDAEVLKSINRISLGTVDLSDFTSTYERTYTIVVPDGTENLSGITEATVTLQIVGLETMALTITNLECINVAEGYKATITTKSLDVTVRGPAESLAELTPSNFTVILDMAEAGNFEGHGRVTATIRIDGFTDVGVIGEYSAIVSVTEDTGEDIEDIEVLSLD